jgi:hypothetical protein
MQYRIVEARNVPALELSVMEWIRKGWKPQGGVMLDPPLYAQAMIKEKKNG